MKLFDIKEDQVTASAEVLYIPEFRVFLDKYGMAKCLNCLGFIYHMVDPKSPYQNLDQVERLKALQTDFDISNIPEIEIAEATNKYQQLTWTPSMKLLHNAKEGAHKLANFFVNYGPDDPLHGKTYVQNLAKSGEIIKQIEILEEKVRKEAAANVKVRGGAQLSSREIRD